VSGRCLSNEQRWGNFTKISSDMKSTRGCVLWILMSNGLPDEVYHDLVSSNLMKDLYGKKKILYT
jgi:hypothetical protein